MILSRENVSNIPIPVEKILELYNNNELNTQEVLMEMRSYLQELHGVRYHTDFIRGLFKAHNLDFRYRSRKNIYQATFSFEGVPTETVVYNSHSYKESPEGTRRFFRILRKEVH